MPEKLQIDRLRAALVYLGRAISILDESGAPGDIAAHVDLARARLNAWLADQEPTRKHHERS